MAVTIASTHCTCPQRDGQAELTWVNSCDLFLIMLHLLVKFPLASSASCDISVTLVNLLVGCFRRCWVVTSWLATVVFLFRPPYICSAHSVSWLCCVQRLMLPSAGTEDDLAKQDTPSLKVNVNIMLDNIRVNGYESELLCESRPVSRKC